MTYSPPPPPMTTTRIPRDVLDEMKRRFPADNAAESIRLAMAALDAKPAEAAVARPEGGLVLPFEVENRIWAFCAHEGKSIEDGALRMVDYAEKFAALGLTTEPASGEDFFPTPSPDEDLPEERPVIELQPPPVLTIEGDGERDQDPVQHGCPACERGSVRRGAPHTCGIPCGPVGDRDRWG
jgi:hypothetical protein